MANPGVNPASYYSQNKPPISPGHKQQPPIGQFPVGAMTNQKPARPTADNAIPDNRKPWNSGAFGSGMDRPDSNQELDSEAVQEITNACFSYLQSLNDVCLSGVLMAQMFTKTAQRIPAFQTLSEQFMNSLLALSSVMGNASCEVKADIMTDYKELLSLVSSCNDLNNDENQNNCYRTLSSWLISLIQLQTLFAQLACESLVPVYNCDSLVNSNTNYQATKRLWSSSLSPVFKQGLSPVSDRKQSFSRPLLNKSGQLFNQLYLPIPTSIQEGAILDNRERLLLERRWSFGSPHNRKNSMLDILDASQRRWSIPESTKAISRKLLGDRLMIPSQQIQQAQSPVTWCSGFSSSSLDMGSSSCNTTHRSSTSSSSGEYPHNVGRRVNKKLVSDDELDKVINLLSFQRNNASGDSNSSHQGSPVPPQISITDDSAVNYGGGGSGEVYLSAGANKFNQGQHVDNLNTAAGVLAGGGAAGFASAYQGGYGGDWILSDFSNSNLGNVLDSGGSSDEARQEAADQSCMHTSTHYNPIGFASRRRRHHSISSYAEMPYFGLQKDLIKMDKWKNMKSGHHSPPSWLQGHHHHVITCPTVSEQSSEQTADLTTSGATAADIWRNTPAAANINNVNPMLDNTSKYSLFGQGNM